MSVLDHSAEVHNQVSVPRGWIVLGLAGVSWAVVASGWWAMTQLVSALF